jgi:hypothetical protein
MIRLLFILLILSACSSSPVKVIKQEHAKGNISLDSILNLAKTSYIKGCIGGMNLIKKKRSHGKRFNLCKAKAQEHRQSLSKLLKEK